MPPPIIPMWPAGVPDLPLWQAAQAARLAGWSGQPWRDQDAQHNRDGVRTDPAPAGRADAVIDRLMKKRPPTT